MVRVLEPRILIAAWSAIVSGLVGWPEPARASCLDPTFCYCEFSDHQAVVVYVEVEAGGQGLYDLRALRDPVFDAGAPFTVGQLLEGVGCDPDYDRGCAELAIGDLGLALIAPGDLNLRVFLPEQAGLFLCQFEPGFGGIPIETLEQVILSIDCRQAVLDLEGYPPLHCGTSCAHQPAPPGRAPVAWLLVLLCGVLARRSRTGVCLRW